MLFERQVRLVQRIAGSLRDGSPSRRQSDEIRPPVDGTRCPSNEPAVDEPLDVVAERGHRYSGHSRDLGGRDRTSVTHVREDREQEAWYPDLGELEVDHSTQVLRGRRGLQEQVSIRHVLMIGRVADSASTRYSYCVNAL